MLSEVRNIAKSLWSVVDGIEEKGLVNNIPMVDEDTSLKAVMQAEIVQLILSIYGTKWEINDRQSELLGTFLDMEINAFHFNLLKAKNKEIEKVYFSQILPFFAIIGVRTGLNIAEVYFQFISRLGYEFVKASDKADLEAVVNFKIMLENNKKIIETLYGREVDFDPLSGEDEEKMEQLDKICNLKRSVDGVDEKFEAVITSLEQLKIDNPDTNFYVESNGKSNDNTAEKMKAEEERPVNKCRTNEQIQKELNELIGLEEVKLQVQSMFNIVKVRKMCE